jgi:hypothetical protein
MPATRAHAPSVRDQCARLLCQADPSCHLLVLKESLHLGVAPSSLGDVHERLLWHSVASLGRHHATLRLVKPPRCLAGVEGAPVAPVAQWRLSEEVEKVVSKIITHIYIVFQSTQERGAQLCSPQPESPEESFPL